MSAISDKARFYLEQAIPQLQEFNQKKIFSKDEIRTLVKKRSDFEHKILARGSKPADFARYAAWEMGLERLREKRCKRLKIKGSSAHAGQARIFLIFDRATRKHFGDLGLWMSYLKYIREVKAGKKFSTVLTSALRMHPTKSDIWLYAAKWALESESDMNGARSYMQRGTRFCTRNKELWIEYAKLEMIYLAKISMRRKILGLDGSQISEAPKDAEDEEKHSNFESSENMIPIPEFKANTSEQKIIDGAQLDGESINDPMTTPALSGAIPLAIFDDAQRQQFYSAAVAEEFFEMFSAFTHVHSLPKILQHVLNSMMELFPTDPSTYSCYVLHPTVGLSPRTPDFPRKMITSLERLQTSLEKTSDKGRLADKISAWIMSMLATEGLDDGIRTALKHTLFNLEKLK